MGIPDPLSLPPPLLTVPGPWGRQGLSLPLPEGDAGDEEADEIHFDPQYTEACRVTGALRREKPIWAVTFIEVVFAFDPATALLTPS